VFPLYGFWVFVVVADVTHEFSLEVIDGGKDAAGYEVVLDIGEPQLHLVEPGGVGGREVKANLFVLREKVCDGPGLVGRQIVGDDVNLFVLRLASDNIVEKGFELSRGVAALGFAQHCPGLGVEGRIQR
jgi:hypothetical protein